MTKPAREQSRIRKWLRHGVIMIAIMLGCSSVRVQAFQVRVLLVSASSVPARVRALASAALSGLAELADSAEYARAAADARLAPASAEALTRIAPSLHARLIVALSLGPHDMLAVSIRDGYSGAVIREFSLPLRHHTLSADAQRSFIRHARSVLGMQGQAPPIAEPLAAPEPEPGEAAPVPAREPDVAAPVVPTPEPEPDQPPARQSRPEASEAEPAAADSGMAAEPPDTSDNAPAGSPPELAERLGARIGCGLGVGERSLRVPSQLGEHRLDTGLFPAVELSLRAQAPLNERATLGLDVHYRTSVGLVVAEAPLSAATQEHTTLRSHHIDFGLHPAYRFAASEDAVSLGLFAGWGMRGLRPVVEFRSIPANTLQGAVFRLELRIPIASGLFALRLAPELFVIAHTSGALRNESASAPGGIAGGGEATLDVRLSAVVYLVATYRESHARLASSWASQLTDVERFATLSAVLRY